MIKKIFSIKDEPWVSTKTKNWLNTYLGPVMIVFEYGSGGSSIFISKRVRKLISVEYQRIWYLIVLINLVRWGIWNFKLHLAVPEVKDAKEKNYLSSDPVLSRFCFKDFVSTIDKYPDNYFDLVFVDGRARNDCIKHAIPKVKKNGFLLLDDSNREVYLSGKQYLSKYKEVKLNGASVWKII